MTLSGPVLPGSRFTWEEVVRTSHRDLLATNRAYVEGSAEVQAHVRQLAALILDPLRAHYGAPVVLHSWVRCPALNAAVGGVRDSQHLDGSAADLHVSGVPLDAVWTWLRGSRLPFSQIILEPIGAGPDGWLHVGHALPGRPVGQAIR